MKVFKYQKDYIECCNCHQIKSKEQFSEYRIKKRSYICRKCENRLAKERYRKKRKKNPNYKTISTNKIKKLSKINAKWLAGIIDCDGWISIIRKEIGIANTNKKLIETIQKITDGGSIRILSSKNKKLYHLSFRVKETLELIPQILPFLIIKGNNAIKILEKHKKQNTWRAWK